MFYIVLIIMFFSIYKPVFPVFCIICIINNNNNNNDLLSEMENPKWKIFFGNSFLPNWSWARQPLSSARSTLLYPFQMLSAKQGSSNSHLLTSFGMTRPGIEPTTSRLWGGRSTDWANTFYVVLLFECIQGDWNLKYIIWGVLTLELGGCVSSALFK